jgi:hypothetical protein
MVAQKKKLAAASDESDTIDAFIALGGAEDLSGRISIARLKAIVKEFGLTIDIQVRALTVDCSERGRAMISWLRCCVKNYLCRLAGICPSCCVAPRLD